MNHDLTFRVSFLFQRKYYHHASPAVMQNLQDLDEKRIKHLANFILKAITAERDVLPIVGQCLDGMEKFTREIDEKEVSLRSECSTEFIAEARFI